MIHRLQLSFLLSCLITIFSICFSYAVVLPDREPPEQTYKPGELLVKFKAEVDDATRAAVHARLGSSVIKEFHSIRVQHIKLREDLAVEEAIKLYQAEPTVQYAEPVGIVHTQKDTSDTRSNDHPKIFTAPE